MAKTEFPQSIYIHLDGDGIGDHLELLLMDEKISEAKLFSEAINKAINDIKIMVEDIAGASTILVGGDDVIIVFDAESFHLDKIKLISGHFYSLTGCTMSGGIGTSVQAALNNLRRAKLSGKDRIVS